MRKLLWAFACLCLFGASPLWADLPNACDPNFCNGKAGDPDYGACCDCYSDRVCLPINENPRVWNDAFVKCVSSSPHKCCKPSSAGSFSGVPADLCSSNANCTEQDGDVCTIPTCATVGSWGGNDCPSDLTKSWDFTPTGCREIKLGDPWFPGENPPDPVEYQCCKAGFGPSGNEYQCCVDRVKAGGVVGTPAAGPHCPGTTGGGSGGGSAGSGSGGSGTSAGEPSTGADAGATGSDEGPKTTDDPVGESAAVPAGPNYMSGGSCGCRIEAGHGVDVSPLSSWLMAALAMVSPLAFARLASAKAGRR